VPTTLGLSKNVGSRARHPLILTLTLSCLVSAGCGSGEDAGGEDGALTLTTVGGPTTAGDASTTMSASDTTDADTSDASGVTSVTDTADSTSATTATTDATATDDTTSDTGMQDEPPRDSLMSAFLDDALMRAGDIDAGLALTQINAMGIDATGRVGIDGETGFVRRWNFGFTNPNDNHQVSIIYMSESWTGEYPAVEDPAGNVTTTDPILNVGSLPDSDEIVDAYAAQSLCGALNGAESDNFLIRYDVDRGGNVLQFTAGGGSWGVDLPGFGAWYDC
jgi:hypothetical protein